MIDIRCLHSLTEALPFRHAIDALNLASTRPDPFSTFDFYANHLRHAAPSTRLWLLLAFDAERLVGYLPLKRGLQRVLGVQAAKLDLLTAHKADRPHLVACADDAAAVSAAIYAYLLSRKREWSLLEFAQQDAASCLIPPPPQAATGAFRSQQWPNMANGTVALRWASTAAYFAALSKKFRSNVSRQMRTLMAAGDVQVLTSSDPAALAPLFELYRSVEAQSWKAQTEAGFGGDSNWVGYYQGLMAADQPMQITLQILLLDEIPIAGLMTGAFCQRRYALHIVYDDSQAALAPGMAILLMGMRLAIESGSASFNLLHGFGYYKARWLAEMNDTRSLQIYRVGTPFYWRRLLGDLKRRYASDETGDPTALLNPARREIERAEPTPTAAAPAAAASIEERARYAVLIAAVRRGRGEFLSARQLAAVLPFETRLPGADDGGARSAAAVARGAVLRRPSQPLRQHRPA